MNTWYHSKSSARKWGGTPEDYEPIHSFIDSSKQVIGDSRHRSMYHHTLGCYLVERIFGKTLTTNGRLKAVEVPTRLIAERHIIEDLGWLPSPKDYVDNMTLAPWMSGSQRKSVPLTTLIPTGLDLDAIHLDR